MREVAPTFADVGTRMRGVPMLFDLDLLARPSGPCDLSAEYVTINAEYRG